MNVNFQNFLRTIAFGAPTVLGCGLFFGQVCLGQEQPKPASAPDVKQAVRDAVRDPRDPRDPARDLSRDARDPETFRKPASTIQEPGRDSNRDKRGDVQANFRVEGTRSADFGIWFERDTSRGLVIADISPTGAIAQLGFRTGDRVVSVNGQRVTREADFVAHLFDEQFGNGRSKVVVIRDGREEVIVVEPANLVEEMSYEQHDPLENFGIYIDDRYDDRIQVWRVTPRSPAFYAGIRAGDVLVSLGDQRLTGVANLVQRLTNLNAGEIQVQVNRGSSQRNIVVDVPQFVARTERRPTLRPNIDAAERREDRLERREERIEERQDRRDDRLTPAPRSPITPVVPVPVPTPTVDPPAVPPVTPAPAPQTKGEPAPRPGLFPRIRN